MLEIESENFIQFGVFVAPLDIVLRGIVSRIQGYSMRTSVNVNPIRFGVGDVHAFSGGSNFNIATSELKIFTAEDHKYSVYTSNLQDGWHSLFYGVSLDLKCEAMWLRSSADKAQKDQYVQNFEIYRRGQLARIVNIYWDGKWIFYENGKALPFEVAGNYDRRNVKGRMVRADVLQVLHEFCPNLNIENGADGFRITLEAPHD